MTLQKATTAATGTAPSKACGEPACSTSTGLHDDFSFGSGELSPHGFWEKPCAVCARAEEVRDWKIVGSYWPFPPESAEREPGQQLDVDRGVTDECHRCWTRSDHAVPEELAGVDGALTLTQWFFLDCPECGESWVVTHLERGRVIGKFRRSDARAYHELATPHLRETRPVPKAPFAPMGGSKSVLSMALLVNPPQDVVRIIDVGGSTFPAHILQGGGKSVLFSLGEKPARRKSNHRQRSRSAA